jgi:hypothetical protein
MDNRPVTVIARSPHLDDGESLMATRRTPLSSVEAWWMRPKYSLTARTRPTGLCQWHHLPSGNDQFANSPDQAWVVLQVTVWAVPAADLQ